MEDLVNIIDDVDLITSVKNKPVLWNTMVHNHEDKIAQAAAWREIFIHLMKDFETMEEKKRIQFGKLIIKRWKSIRQTWLKTIEDQKPPQEYHNVLSFHRKFISEPEPGEVERLIQPPHKRQFNAGIEETATVKRIRLDPDVEFFDGSSPNEQEHIKFWSGLFSAFHGKKPSKTEQYSYIITDVSKPSDPIVLVSSSSSSPVSSPPASPARSSSSSSSVKEIISNTDSQ